MSYLVQCRCGQQMSVDQSHAGMQFACVGCNATFTVPPNPHGAVVVPVSPTPAPVAQVPQPAPVQQRPPVPYQQQMPPQQMPYGPLYVQTPPKNPGVALVLSFFWCGVGQLYNGQVGKGIGFIVLYALCILLCFLLIGFILAPAVWVLGMVDAYTSAQSINRAAGFLS